MDKQEHDELVSKTCLLAGKILIENGSEIRRVVDTMTRIATNAGEPNLKSYVTLTGIILSLNNKSGDHIAEVGKRSFDLHKIASVNSYSRDFAENRISLKQFYLLLNVLKNYAPSFPVWFKMLAAATVSGSIELIFRGNPSVVIITGLVGMSGWYASYLINKLVNVEFVSEFVAALVIGLLGILAVKIGWGNSVSDIIIGGLMCLVPGVQIANGVRDLMAGDLVSGAAREIEAFIEACAFGFGVVLALRLFG